MARRAQDAVMRGVFEADDVREKVGALKDKREKLRGDIDRIEQSIAPAYSDCCVP